MRCAVIGGGLMGCGIGQVLVGAGHDVVIIEPSAAVRAGIMARILDGLTDLGQEPSLIERINVVGDLAKGVGTAEFVTEAAPERLELKQDIFAALERAGPADAILASNSSVIPITRISEGLVTAHRMVGTHWWNPAPLIPLVEVIQGAQTSDETVSRTMEFLQQAGKVPAHIRKDVPGFVGNRLQHALWREAIAMVAEGICDAQTLDACVRNSFGQRLAVLGPLENADLVGLDLTLDIHRTIIPELDRHSGPHEYLSAKVAAGDLGFKTGSGFREWSEDEMTALRSRLTSHLLKSRDERRMSERR